MLTGLRHSMVSLGLPACVAAVAALGTACVTTSAITTPEPVAVTFQDKLSWMLRLEDQRILRDPTPTAPVVLVPATKGRPAVVAPPPPSDLVRLMHDSEGRVRRRAALALGRVGLPDAIPALQEALQDQELEVRQMAAFSLGLIGDRSAREALVMALGDTSPVVQGRAAEALAAIGSREDAPAIGQMVARHLRDGALAGIEPDDLRPSIGPPVEAVRLGLFALARLAATDTITGVVLNADGSPVSRWWPVAFTLGRASSPAATQALRALIDTPGRYTSAFAIQALGRLRSTEAAGTLRTLVEQRQRDVAVVVEAVRALGTMRDTGSLRALLNLAGDTNADGRLRVEAVNAATAIGGGDASDDAIELMLDRDPLVRAAATRLLAVSDPETFLRTLSGLDVDSDWGVRAALAEALGGLPDGAGVARLRMMVQDADPRVIPSVVAALVAARTPDAERVLVSLLGSPDDGVVAAAAGSLGEMKADGAANALAQALTGAGRRSYTVRAALLSSLHAISASDARPLLERALADPDWAVRVKAADLLKADGVDPVPSIRPALSRPIADPQWQALVTPAFSPHAFIQTARGTIEVELAVLDAPFTVWNFMALARSGFFNGLTFHRVVSNFVVQGGDPHGDGAGGPGYTIRDEINQRPYLRGTIGMALDWRDTGGSQFFITHAPQPHLDGRYTVFGDVVNGMDVVDRIQPRDVIQRIQIWDGVELR